MAATGVLWNPIMAQDVLATFGSQRDRLMVVGYDVHEHAIVNSVPRDLDAHYQRHACVDEQALA